MVLSNIIFSCAYHLFWWLLPFNRLGYLHLVMWKSPLYKSFLYQRYWCMNISIFSQSMLWSLSQQYFLIGEVFHFDGVKFIIIPLWLLLLVFSKKSSLTPNCKYIWWFVVIYQYAYFAIKYVIDWNFLYCIYIVFFVCLVSGNSCWKKSSLSPLSRYLCK